MKSILIFASRTGVVIATIAFTLLAFSEPAAADTEFTVPPPTISARDLDQDGVPNATDTCPMNVNGPDGDGDGIYDICDTDLPLATGADVDSDGNNNTLDNCPQVNNPGQADTDGAAADGGPTPDGIGDDCDSGVATVTQNGHPVTITLSPTVPNGRYTLQATFSVACVGGTDADGDGYCAGAGDNADSGACASADMANFSGVSTATNATSLTHSGGVAFIPGHFVGSTVTSGGSTLLVTSNTLDTVTGSGGWSSGTPAPGLPYSIDRVPTNTCFLRHTLWSGSGHPLLQLDTDGDTVAGWSGSTSNWSDYAETYLGTDPTKPCAQSSGSNNEGPLDNWPLDMSDNRRVGGEDYLKYNTVLGAVAGGNRAINQGGNGDGTATTPATIAVPGMGIQSQQRFDLNFDGFLNGSDLGKFNPYMSRVCGFAFAPPLTNGGTFQQ